MCLVLLLSNGGDECWLWTVEFYGRGESGFLVQLRKLKREKRQEGLVERVRAAYAWHEEVKWRSLPWSSQNTKEKEWGKQQQQQKKKKREQRREETKKSRKNFTRPSHPFYIRQTPTLTQHTLMA
jgi:hypothetical protein